MLMKWISIEDFGWTLDNADHPNTLHHNGAKQTLLRRHNKGSKNEKYHNKKGTIG